MDQAPRELSPNALTAFTALYPDEKPSWLGRPQSLRISDAEFATVGLELIDGKVMLHLSQDCPFDEISPAYLAIFVQKLAELYPDVPVAYIPGYGHPIVATLPLEVPADASVEAWTAAILSTIPRLEGALSHQREAAERFRDDDDVRWDSAWPEVSVTPDELTEIGQLEDESALERERLDRQELERVSTSLLSRLGRLKVIKPDRPWVRCLRFHELHSGFWSGVYVERFTASQLVVTLNAIYQGNLYNTNLVNRACGDRLFARISARARELATGSDPINVA